MLAKIFSKRKFRNLTRPFRKKKENLIGGNIGPPVQIIKCHSMLDLDI